MQMAAGMEVHMKGYPYRIVFCDDVEVTLCDLEDRKRRKHIPRDDFDVAFLAGEVTPYIEGFHPEVWRENRDRSEKSLTAAIYSPAAQADIDYKLPYARYFIDNTVGEKEQDEVVQQIAEELGHSRVPGPSTARRWAQKLRASAFNPASLIDRRRKSFQ